MTLALWVIGSLIVAGLVLDLVWKAGRINGYKRGIAKTEHEFAQLIALGGVGAVDGAGPRLCKTDGGCC